MTPECRDEAEAVCSALAALARCGASSDDVGPLRARLLKRLASLVLPSDEPTPDPTYAVFAPGVMLRRSEVASVSRTPSGETIRVYLRSGAFISCSSDCAGDAFRGEWERGAMFNGVRAARLL